MPFLPHALTITKDDTYAKVRINFGEDLTGFTAPLMNATDVDQVPILDHVGITGSVEAPATGGIVSFSVAATLAATVATYHCNSSILDGLALRQTGPEFQVVCRAKVQDLTP